MNLIPYRPVLIVLSFALSVGAGELAMDFGRASGGASCSSGGELSLNGVVGLAEATVPLEGGSLTLDTGLLALFVIPTTPSTAALPRPAVAQLAYPLDGNWAFQLAFSSAADKAYQIQYKDDLMGGWKISPITLSGNGAYVSWIDNGPPFTDTTPATTGYYRVIGPDGSPPPNLSSVLVPKFPVGWRKSLKFPTEAGLIYFVQYRDGFNSPWKTAITSIVGTGYSFQWLDSGPPITDPSPGDMRFYRILAEP